jgi:hypothetical protein
MYKFDGRFVLIGVVIWLAFLILVRVLGTTVFTIGNPFLPVIFVVAIPMIIVTIYLVSGMTGVSVRDMPMPVFVMTFTALMLDGLAVGFTELYGDTHEQIRASAAFLLWGGGLGMVCSLILANRKG